MLDRLLAAAVAVPFALGLSTAAPAERESVELTFRDPEVVESSGLVVQDGLVHTTNDSGDSGRVFTVDPGTGRTVGVTRWAEAPRDVEALAPAGDGAVWVGDIGDNTESRDAVEVTRVPVGRGQRTVTEATFALVYPDGPADAESLLAHPTTGRLYVATKSVFGGRLYAAPRSLSADRPNRLRPVGRVLPLATDGAFLPDGEHLVLRGYARAAVYSLPALDRVGEFPLPPQEQGEGIAVADEGTVLVSTEGQFSDVLRVRLPDEVRQALAPASPSPSQASPSTPAEGGYSREGRELPEQPAADRPVWPWFLTAWLVLGGLVILMRALRLR